ncbi:hypothetical protein VM1G_07958 [Cytospora mali]|uniref:Uncharacterized protein n=1 Tax=Cytospora mali TaxID=578113 RepID=A0A194W7A4_CYTMA|nr:hypothetical protein VM1G_07958 [Valsa mali]
MVDITEICPDGSTLTTTSTETYEVMTRSICHTSTPSLPCYACDFGIPTGDHLMTVATTSNSASPAATPDVTLQMCSSCHTSILSTAVLGYVAGTACHNCQPSATGNPSAPTLAIQKHEVESVSPGKPSKASFTGDGYGPESSRSASAAPTATFVTAGTSRNVVHPGLIALVLGLFMAIW